jgi:hypothetical protein
VQTVYERTNGDSGQANERRVVDGERVKRRTKVEKYAVLKKGKRGRGKEDVVCTYIITPYPKKIQKG